MEDGILGDGLMKVGGGVGKWVKVVGLWVEVSEEGGDWLFLGG